MDQAESKTTKPTRRHFTSEEKVRLIKEHLVDKVPLSEICTRVGLQPSQFYLWQQDFFRRAQDIFNRQPDGSTLRQDKQVAALEAKLVRRDEALAELMQDHVALRKKLGAT
jgi:transposase-like protein